MWLGSEASATPLAKSYSRFAIRRCNMTTTRRSFMVASAVGAVAPFVKAQDKSGSKYPILGEGEHKFECIHDWGELPSNIKYGNTHSVCEDAQGHIYVHHTVHKTSDSPDSVVVFDAKGKFVRS